MTRKSPGLDEKVYDYLLSVSLTEHDILRRCREQTAPHRLARMQIAPEQGQFFSLLIQALKVRNIIEIGVFTGYSTLAMALALPDNGKIIACDHDPDTTAWAQSYWQAANVSHKVDLRIGPALETLKGLIQQRRFDEFDFAFIDAHKPEYIDYYECLLQLVRPGGMIAVDNVLWSGQVADDSFQDEDTTSIRAFNDYLLQDGRVSICLLPMADGISLALKK